MARVDVLDNGPAEVLVLQAPQATLDTGAITVAGGVRADVFVEDDQVLVQVERGHPAAVELVRAVLSAPSLQVHGDVLDVVVVTGAGWDRVVLSGDLEHRWLFTRHWERRPGTAAVAGVVGHSPLDAETVPRDVGAHATLAAAAGLLAAEIGPPRTLHLTTVFTRRTSNAGAITGVPRDRRADPGVVGPALDEADAILAAWGPVPQPGSDAVDTTVDLLRAQRDRGARVLVRSHADTLETAGTPAQPAADPNVRPGTRLVDAPAEWLWGGQLVG